MSHLRGLIADRIRTTGPMSLAEFMKLALYHPSYGYYARTSRRTGRAGDFFTSVDVGPVFGELLARQLAEMREIVRALDACPAAGSRQPAEFDLVEAGAGSGRLARDVLDAAAHHYPDLYGSLRLHLVEISPAACAAQVETLGHHASKLTSTTHSLPEAVSGVILANELLDALPTHAVVMSDDGLREVFVDLDSVPGNATFVERELAPSTPELEHYLVRVGVRLEPGWRAEINLEAPAWIRQAARSLRRGFLMLLDYGHDAAELYSGTHSAGTLTTFQRHVSSDRAGLLQDPGEHDITAHVDLTTVTSVAEESGLVTLGRLDQTYFLLGLAGAEMLDDDVFNPSATLSVDGEPRRTVNTATLKKRLALKTLMVPGGLGSTLKVLIFAKDVGTPKLKGLSYRTRLT